MSYFVLLILLNCLNISFSELIISVREERAIFLLSITSYFVISFRNLHLSLSVWEKTCHLIVSLSEPSV